MSEGTARLVWRFGEPVHAVVFYAPETRAATGALGLKGGSMSYFGCRAAPLGAVAASVVTTAFYNFRPSMVERAIPDAWTYATPSQPVDALQPLASTVMEAGAVPWENNMGFPWPPRE